MKNFRQMAHSPAPPLLPSSESFKTDKGVNNPNNPASFKVDSLSIITRRF